MSTSGSKSVSVGTGATLKFEWSQSSQSVANNTTTISWTMKLIMSSGYSISSSASKDWSVTVNGTKYSGSNTVGVSAGGTKTLASGSTTIGHNSDGTKTFSYSFSQEFAITYNGSSVGTKSGSGSGTLNTIARASSISGGTGNIGSNVTITISRASNSFTHTLTYSFGSLSGTIATKTTSTSVSWTIPTSFYAQIPNAKSGTGTIKCETFNGSTSIGSKSISFTAKVTGSEPTLNPQAYVASDSITAQLTGSTTKFIKNFTTVTVSTGASTKNSATIKSQKITCGNQSISSGSGTISNPESDKFTFSATDSRGYTTTQTLTRTLVNYVNPTIAWSSVNISTDGIATLKVNGVCFNGSFGAVNNTIKVQYQYKADGGSWSSWSDFTLTRNGNNYTGTASVSGLDYRKKYVFKAWIGDKFFDLKQNNGVYTAEKAVKCIPIFDWGENDFNFNVPVYYQGSLIPPYTTSGNRWGVSTSVDTNGIMEVGKYIDFHDTDGDTSDYCARLYHYKDGWLSTQRFDVSYWGFAPLRITRNDGSTNGAAICFANGNGVLGYIGMYGSADDGLYRYSADTKNQYRVLDSAGGQINGSIIVQRDGYQLRLRPASEGQVVQITLENSSGVRKGYIGSPNSSYELHIQSEASSIYLRGQAIHCRNNGHSAYVACHASAFTVGSEAKWKDNIQPFEKSAMDMINQTVVYEYNRTDNPNQKEIGLVIDNGVPEELVREIIHGQGLEVDENQPMTLSLEEPEMEVDKTVDLYTMCSISWKALQEKDEEIQQLQNKVDELQSKNEELEQRLAKLESLLNA